MRVLEIGAGNLPYVGVTHLVDKYPDDPTHRGHGALEAMAVPQGMEFREGEFESLPFKDEERFDFIFARHVFEHVKDASAAVGELNRLSSRGYIETPSPIKEMLSCKDKHDPDDIHTYFVWNGKSKNELCVVRKSDASLAKFGTSSTALLAKKLTEAHRRGALSLSEQALTRRTRTNEFWYTGPIKLTEFKDLEEADHAGYEPFGHLKDSLWWSRLPLVWARKKSRPFREAVRSLSTS